LAHGFGFDRGEQLMRHLNAAGYIMIGGFEGLRLTAYRDIAGVWTIGYGPHGSGSEGRDHHRGPSLPGTLTPSGGQIRHRHEI
jgi:GH24 family phage-related lysozyme (muramidase)